MNEDDMESRMENILSFINSKMTDYSSNLDLEHSGSALQLNLSD